MARSRKPKDDATLAATLKQAPTLFVSCPPRLVFNLNPIALARRFTSRYANPFTLAPLNTPKRYICSANTGGNNTVDDNTIHNSKVGNARSGATSTGVLPNRSSGKRS